MKEINWSQVLSELSDSDKGKIKEILEKEYVFDDDFPLLTSGHPVVEEDGVLRFKGNSIINDLFYEGKLDLNNLAVHFHHKKFSLEDYMQLYRMLGYSLSGFMDVFGHKWDEIHHPEKI